MGIDIFRCNNKLQSVMTSSLSKKDVEEIKPYVDRTVQKFLGFSEPSLVTTALNCLTSGYDKRKTSSKYIKI
jgi:U4/U6 small nuclear ribonucleoprotein PRP3